MNEYNFKPKQIKCEWVQQAAPDISKTNEESIIYLACQELKYFIDRYAIDLFLERFDDKEEKYFEKIKVFMKQTERRTK